MIFSSISSTCNVLGFTQANRRHRIATPFPKTEFNTLWGLMNSVHLSEIQDKKRKKGKSDREMTPCGWFQRWIWLQLHYAFPSWLTYRVDGAGKPVLLSRILDQSLPSFWPSRAVDSGIACLHLQTTALQTCPGDWWNHVVGYSIINPADSSLSRPPGKWLHQQQLNRISPCSTPFQCKRSYL